MMSLAWGPSHVEWLSDGAADGQTWDGIGRVYSGGTGVGIPR